MSTDTDCGPLDGSQGDEQPPKARTLPEALDAAQNGAQFGAVLQGLFAGLEAARDREAQGMSAPKIGHPIQTSTGGTENG